MKMHYLSVIRQRANLKTGFSRKQSKPNFPKKQTFLTPWYAHVRLGSKYALQWHQNVFKLKLISKFILTSLIFDYEIFEHAWVKFSLLFKSPATIYVFKLAIEALEKGVKYVKQCVNKVWTMSKASITVNNQLYNCQKLVWKGLFLFGCRLATSLKEGHHCKCFLVNVVNCCIWIVEDQEFCD